MAEAPDRFAETIQLTAVFRHQLFAPFLHDPQTFHGRSDEQIRGAGTLISLQGEFHLLFVHQRTADMKNGGLSQGGQRFVETLDNDIGAAAQCVLRKILAEAEMRAVGGVDDERYAEAVGDLRDGCHIADDPLVGGGNDEHGGDAAVLRKSFFHILRVDAPVYAELRHGRRHKPQRFQPSERHGVQRRFMAVPRQQDRIAGAGHGGDGAEDPGGGAVDEKIRSVAFVKGGGVFHGFSEDALGVVEIVKALDFGDVVSADPVHKAAFALMPRHVHGQYFRCAVVSQRIP